MSVDAPADAASWYKDAVIYQLHVKTFCDSNGDGVGDFPGLISRLDYLQRLGVTCLWLLPFYESPLLDDGYDVADYERVHAAYGTLDDVRCFLAAAHHRGMRVIAELVINHTSDQHPWFQSARQAPPGSAAREFYVWSDTTGKYRDARIIFRDTESSNWSWDAVAGAYYWHRFFHHQPDLNFDHPDVRAAVLGVMRFWLDLGVDGLRLDAIAHLIERDGTSCDNLPETHAYLRALRAVLDAEYPDRVLLAEVNQSPDETRAYFGAGVGDECHMAFHFPLMPRLFQALATGEAAPLITVLRQTIDIPETAQWAIFLRNHDELTLSALSPAEREPLLQTYAPVPRMRLNHGIRRRLAPLLGDNPQRILLATTLTLSLPGTPVIYYGDEIGMGDNIALADRDGVRTPMQWNSEPGGGFMSPDRVAAVRPVLPLLDDAVYGYRRINVAVQDADPQSLLNAVRLRIRVRQQYGAFGRGRLVFCESSNARVLAFVRQCGADTLLVAANLSRSDETVQLELPSDVGDLMAIDQLAGLVLRRSGRRAEVSLPGSAVGWWTLDQQNG